ncbi:apolipoprotein L4-like [Dendropsophus ebraccatus]|uniref:apolipoprotein L4-like n=1 Tax=Dendropsophus ebraccatus TaxID=150705 RepID=UPI0038312352
MTHSANQYEQIPCEIELSEGYVSQYIKTLAQLIETTKSCILEMTIIANELDRFHRGATIASVTGSSFGIAGGILTIVGLALIPVTLGASLIVSGVGVGVAVAGGVTGAGASIADIVNIRQKTTRVQEIVDRFNAEMKHLKEISAKIASVIETLQSRVEGFDQNKSIEFTRLFGRGVFASTEIGRLAQLGKITTLASRGAQLASRGVQAATAISGVLAGVFIILDAYYIVRGAIDLHRGGRTEEAAKVRDCAKDLEKIYLDLQAADNLCKCLSLL